jgi:hypothetical protein
MSKALGLIPTEKIYISGSTYSWIRRFNVIKIISSPQVSLQMQCNPCQSLSKNFFANINKIIVKRIPKTQHSQNGLEITRLEYSDCHFLSSNITTKPQ